MTIPRVGVLALQGDVREHLAAFAATGAEVTVVREPDDLGEVDALALPGGESTTMSRLLRVFGLEAPLRARIADGMPCFATCAGLILLAREITDGRPDQLVFGAFDVAVQRNGFGRQVDSFEAALQIVDIDGDFPGMFIRAPRIISVGPAARSIARCGDDIVGVAQGASVGLSFHPEMTTDTRLHDLFVRGVAARMSRSAA